MIDKKERCDKALEVIKAEFKRRGWKNENEDEVYAAETSIFGEDLVIPIRIHAIEEYGIIHIESILPYVVAKENVAAIAEAVCRVNYKMPNGNFDFDINNLRIIYRFSCNIIDRDLSIEFLQNSLDDAIKVIDDYNERFGLVDKGKCKPSKILIKGARS